jgi:hypothetical protein
MGIAGGSAEGDLDALARLFQIHSAFRPRAYVDFHVERAGDAVLCSIRDCSALAEGDAFSWFALLAASEEPHPALDAIARVIHPQARCRPAEVDGARVAWSVIIDPHAEPAPEPPPVAMVRMSKGASFRFEPRR